MNDQYSYRKIVRLIILELNGDLNADEETEFNQWINDQPENKLLYQRIKNSGNFKQWQSEYNSFDVDKGWLMMDSMIRKSERKLIIRKALRYAAIFLLPVLVLAGVYLYHSTIIENDIPTFAETKEIMPGKPKALLIFNDGQAISLDSINSESFLEKDGTLIEKQAQSLDYSKNSSKAETKIIYNTIQVPKGGEYNLILADGTRVYLNSESRLKYPVQFSASSRTVELSGEAYFEVAKNEKKPFVVNTYGMSLKVLGTCFNLNAYENNGRIVTTLVEGSVGINAPGSNKNWVLKPEEQATFDVENGDAAIKVVDVNFYIGWKDGILNFYDSRLEDIMTGLVRWYDAEVIYLDESVKDYRFTGSLDRYGSINQILDIIRSTDKVKISVKGNVISFGK